MYAYSIAIPQYLIYSISLGMIGLCNVHQTYTTLLLICNIYITNGHVNITLDNVEAKCVVLCMVMVKIGEV